MSADPAVIVHAHMFKNAGTTVDWVLARNFGPAFMAHTADVEMKRGGSTYLYDLLAGKPQLQALSSHCLPVSSVENTAHNYSLIGFLRHPLARVRSVYTFERQQQADTPGAMAAKDKSFPDYVRWRLRADVRPVLRDFQTRYLLEQGESLEFKPDDNAFAMAWRRAQRFTLMGVVERFSESMVLGKHQLSDKFPALDVAFIAQNRSEKGAAAHALKDLVTPEDTLRKQLGGDLCDQLIEANGYDLRLYAQVNKLLDERLAGVDDLSERLSQLQQLNLALLG